MSWGDLVEGGAYLGTHIALDGASLFILKKLPSAGGKFLSGLNKYSKAAKAEETIAVASKGLSIANQCGLDTAIGVKLATEYGTDGAAKIFKIIEQHPEILKQEGKNIVQVVQEVAEQSHLRPNPGYEPKAPRGVRMRQIKLGSDKLPNQGFVSAEKIPGAPLVDAGKQGKHIFGHNNCNPKKSLWPAGENGVELTQEAWMKGRVTGNPIVRKYTKNGLEIKVHMDEKGYIHGYPDYLQK